MPSDLEESRDEKASRVVRRVGRKSQTSAQKTVPLVLHPRTRVQPTEVAKDFRGLLDSLAG